MLFLPSDDVRFAEAGFDVWTTALDAEQHGRV